MAAVPSTPRGKTSGLIIPTTPIATPASRALGQAIVQASPHYTTTRRHSLYGIEDRVVIDAGSRVWKVGFSGEGKPRDVFYAGGDTIEPLWTLDTAPTEADREERERMLESRVRNRLRLVFHNSLLTDPKSRKILLIENAMLPLSVKEMLARVLFNNLQVPSLSFAPSSLLALLAVGKITGLVVDCGHLETSALPIFSARPLFPHLKTSPLAGARLSSHLRSLLLLFGTYLPPPSTLSGAVNLPASARSTRVPEEILNEALLEEIKTRCCLVGDALASTFRLASPSPTDEVDVPPSSDLATSDSGHMEIDDDAASSAVSAASNAHGGDSTMSSDRLDALATAYMRHSTASDLQLRVVPPVVQQTGTGRGTLIIPGWIRERAAEVLFEGGDIDEYSVAETVLESLLKVPRDLRKTLVSSILVVGGTPMLPGFIPRLHTELTRVLATLPQRATARPARPLPDRYASLRPLLPHLVILNNPTPPPSAPANVGSAPAFTPASLPWVGGSLSGALKISGIEVPRERWDEADAETEVVVGELGQRMRTVSNVLPDWTRPVLPVGAPNVVFRPAAPLAVGAH